jgi:hypothetical protein
MTKRKEVSPSTGLLTSIANPLRECREHFAKPLLYKFKEEAWHGLNNFVLTPMDEFFIRHLPDKPIFRSLGHSGVVIIMTSALCFTVLNQALPFLLLGISSVSLEMAAKLEARREEFLQLHADKVERQNVAASQLPIITAVMLGVYAVSAGEVKVIIAALAGMSLAPALNIYINYEQENKVVLAYYQGKAKAATQEVRARENKLNGLYEQIERGSEDIEKAEAMVKDEALALAEKLEKLVELQERYTGLIEEEGRELQLSQENCAKLKKRLSLEGSLEEIKVSLEQQVEAREERLNQLGIKKEQELDIVRSPWKRNARAFGSGVGAVAALALAPATGGLSIVTTGFVGSISGALVAEAVVEGDKSKPRPKLEENIPKDLTAQEQDLLAQLGEYQNHKARHQQLEQTQQAFVRFAEAAKLEAEKLHYQQELEQAHADLAEVESMSAEAVLTMDGQVLRNVRNWAQDITPTNNDMEVIR